MFYLNMMNQIWFLLNFTKTLKSNIPGHGYFEKLDQFIELHFEVGELYIEFLKGSCASSQETICDFCSKGWSGPELERVPKPHPNYDRLLEFHYLHCDETPMSDRTVDDFQPRAQLKAEFAAGKLVHNDTDEVKNFSERYLISTELAYY